MIKIADRIIIYTLIIIGIIFLCTSFCKSRSFEEQSERLRDNLLWQTEQAVKRLDIKDKELKELAGVSPTTIIETIIKTEVVNHSVSIPYSISFEGEDSILKWKVKEAIFSYQLKPISITVIESPKGWLFKASEGFYIEGVVHALPEKRNEIWAVIDTDPYIGIRYQNKKYSLAAGRRLNKNHWRITAGIKLITF